MKLIKFKNLIHEYKQYDEEDREIGSVRALDDVSFDIEEGSFVAILGHNGSGKSTLAKHINALLTPTSGTVIVCDRDTKDEGLLYEIRERAGMIFQNPDNQIISSIVEEDVGFGPENIGVPTEDIWKRVDMALEKTNMTAYRLSSPNKLSGGQKQRVAIAGVLAMKPRCIIMDEPTAMLDPSGREEVLATVHELNRQEGITVILITHYMEEAADADRVIVMDEGKKVLDGTPKEIFSKVDVLYDYHMNVPDVTRLAYELKKAGAALPDGILSIDEFTEAVCRLI